MHSGKVSSSNPSTKHGGGLREDSSKNELKLIGEYADILIGVHVIGIFPYRDRRMQRKGSHTSTSHSRILRGSESDQAVAEELKTVTLLTIDIRGFSRLAKQMGPPRTVLLLNRFFAATGEVVFRHYGVVDKYLGDGFLAVFGDPTPGSDDAVNAIRAALEIQRCLAELNRDLRLDFGTTIQIGMSVHTGEVAVGNIGFDKKMDYTVIGDAVNTVFRMQALVKAFPNGILMSEATLRAVRPRFKVQPAALPQQALHDLGDFAVYKLIEHETDADVRVTAAEDDSARPAPAPKTPRKPTPKPPPAILSP